MDKSVASCNKVSLFFLFLFLSSSSSTHVAININPRFIFSCDLHFSLTTSLNHICRSKSTFILCSSFSIPFRCCFQFITNIFTISSPFHVTFNIPIVSKRMVCQMHSHSLTIDKISQGLFGYMSGVVKFSELNIKSKVVVLLRCCEVVVLRLL